MLRGRRGIDAAASQISALTMPCQSTLQLNG
jgi:hypothetical protein